MKPSQTFHDHLAELRRRLLWILIAIAGSGIIGFLFRVPVIRFLQKPLGSPLYYTSPAGSFNFVIKVAYVLGIFIALPIVVFQLIKFIEPALPIKIKNKFLLKVIAASFGLALIGAAFGFFIIIPTSLHFFMGYSTTVIKPLISATEYLTYVVNVIITFALLFQIPLVVLFINYVRPLKPKDILRYQKHVVVGAFILSVVLPFTYDPITQFVMAVPVVFLYYFSIFLIYMVNRNRKVVVPEMKVEAIKNQDLVEDESTPILSIQGAAPVFAGAASANTEAPSLTISAPKGVGRSLDGVIFQKKSKHLKIEIDQSTQSQPPEHHSSKVVDGIINTPKEVKSVKEVGSSSINIEHKKSEEPKTSKTRSSISLDGFLPSNPIKKITQQIKLDDIYPYSVS